MLRVIIIDDESEFVDVLSEFLELRDINVIARGSNGNEAVELYRDLRPDVILLDLHMASSSGFSALQKILRINREAKIIMVTGDPNFDVKQDLRELGASAIVTKPDDIERLPELIESLCKKGFLQQRFSFGKKNSVEDI